MKIFVTAPRLVFLALLCAAAPALAQHSQPAAAGDTSTPEPAAVTSASASTPTPKATPEQLAAFASRYREFITTLADPFFEGRAPGTRGAKLASEYVQFHARMLKLEPAFPEVTKDGEGKVTSSIPNRLYTQEFVAPPSLRPGDSFKITTQAVGWKCGDVTKDLVPGTDYSVIGYSGSAEVTGPLVFVGYANENEERKYDSFHGDAKLDGKIAMMLRFEPMNAEGKSQWSESGWSPAAALDAKVRKAERAGAIGIILINPPGAADERANRLEGLELMGGRRAGKLPIVMMSHQAADDLLKASGGRTLIEMREAADSLAPETSGVIDLNANVTLNVKIEQIPLITENIGGILRGKGALADQYVVVGSHYDHVGYGYFGSRDPNPRGKLHAGADDNASGSSANLLVATRMRETYDALPPDASVRSVLFMWFGAEESGLNGSRYYVKNMIADKDKHAIMLNMDMVGRLRDGKMELGGVATADGLEAWLDSYIISSGLTIKRSKSGFGPSDHASFTGAGIPSLFFFTQLHKEYHTPQDVVSTINFDGAAQVADLAFRIAFDAARRPENFVFANGDAVPAEESSPSGTPAAKEGDQQATPGPVASGVRFGIAPGDYSGDEKGVLIGEVFPDLPAAKAGLKEGDLMIKWDSAELVDVESWMPMLSKAKPGDVVTITYKRNVDGVVKELTTQATLVARARRPVQ